MRIFLLIVLLITAPSIYGQDFEYPPVQFKGERVNEFVPSGWMVLDQSNGDLNNDGIEDVAMALQKKDSVYMENNLGDSVWTKPRMLVVLFRNSSNQFVLKEKSNSFILKHDNKSMDDPFHGLKITNGMLEIKFRLFYNAGSWYVTQAAYRFKFQKEQLVLIGAGNNSFHRANHDYERYSYNFLTGKRLLLKGNDNRRSQKTTWKTMNRLPMKTLKTFSEPFSWEIERGVVL